MIKRKQVTSDDNYLAMYLKFYRSNVLAICHYIRVNISVFPFHHHVHTQTEKNKE